MHTVYVVTHPEATHHVAGLVGGQFDSDLTAQGRDDAERIASALRVAIPSDEPATIFASDLRRTMQTADAISAALAAPVTPDPGLREKSYGAAEGRPQGWLDERFIPPPVAGDRLRHEEGVDGAEAKWDFAYRVYSAVDRALDAGAANTVVVTHGFAATFVIARWIGMPVESTGYVSFRCEAGSITILREDDLFHNRQVAVLNSTGHLHPGRSM